MVKSSESATGWRGTAQFTPVRANSVTNILLVAFAKKISHFPSKQRLKGRGCFSPLAPAAFLVSSLSTTLIQSPDAMEELSGKQRFLRLLVNTSGQRPSQLLQSSGDNGKGCWGCRIPIAAPRPPPFLLSQMDGQIWACFLGTSSSKVQFALKAGQRTAQCMLPSTLSSLFTSFSIFYCHSVLHWQGWCIRSCYPNKHVSRFEKTDLFLLYQSQPMRAFVFLSTQKYGLLGFTNSFRVGFGSPFRSCLILDLERSTTVLWALSVWLILAEKSLGIYWKPLKITAFHLEELTAGFCWNWGLQKEDRSSASDQINIAHSQCNTQTSALFCNMMFPRD